MPSGSDSSPTDLLGRWQLNRRLLDRRAGQFGHVTGTLDLTLVGTIVHWAEQGQMTWAGAVIEVTRELHIVQDDGEWTVHFADGRPFHPWRPGERVEHPCAQDLYRGLISVDRAGTRLRTLWDVVGPTKDQRLSTRCERVRGPATS